MQRAADWGALNLVKGPNGNASDRLGGKASRPALYLCMRRLREHSRRAAEHASKWNFFILITDF